MLNLNDARVIILGAAMAGLGAWGATKIIEQSANAEIPTNSKVKFIGGISAIALVGGITGTLIGKGINAIIDKGTDEVVEAVSETTTETVVSGFMSLFD